MPFPSTPPDTATASGATIRLTWVSFLFSSQSPVPVPHASLPPRGARPSPPCPRRSPPGAASASTFPAWEIDDVSGCRVSRLCNWATFACGYRFSCRDWDHHLSRDIDSQRDTKLIPQMCSYTGQKVQRHPPVAHPLVEQVHAHRHQLRDALHGKVLAPPLAWSVAQPDRAAELVGCMVFQLRRILEQPP